MIFEWDEDKAEKNLRKHGISFNEAVTVFADPLSLTIPDPLHSHDEDRFVITGQSRRLRQLILNAENTSELLARVSPQRARGRSMNQEQNNEREPDMLDEYDFSGGVRGKYAERYARGTNVVVLDPDVAKVFPDSDSVNRALRALAGIIQHQAEKAQSEEG